MDGFGCCIFYYYNFFNDLMHFLAPAEIAALKWSLCGFISLDGFSWQCLIFSCVLHVVITPLSVTQESITICSGRKNVHLLSIFHTGNMPSFTESLSSFVVCSEICTENVLVLNYPCKDVIFDGNKHCHVCSAEFTSLLF